MLKSIALFFDNLLRSMIRPLGGSAGRTVRSWYYSRRFGSCGKNLVIDEGVIIQGARDIHLGDNVWIDRYCILMAGKVSLEQGAKVLENPNYQHEIGELHVGSNVHITPFSLIQAHGGVQIGNDCGTGSGAKIYSLTNLPTDSANPERRVCYSWGGELAQLSAPIVIGNNVGIGLGAVILPAVTIEDECFVAPYSIVMSPIKANSFVSGNPARKVRERFPVTETEKQS
ncbi:acyltransferase [Thiothrix subterranea]|uniref:acyltransferase n=1 Tax=Thiothrix subterranea TaxID=2735563 RepID=UPI00192BDCBD|nr:acyltransferase [Thiothrix subterranea]QQZ29406.1 acyltransferase [Thiothrix subterranea]